MVVFIKQIVYCVFRLSVFSSGSGLFTNLFELFQDLILVPPFYHYEKRASLGRKERFLPGSDTAPTEAEQNLKTSAAGRSEKGFFNMPKPVTGFEGYADSRNTMFGYLKFLET